MEFPPGSTLVSAELKPTGWQLMGASGPTEPPVEPPVTPPPTEGSPDFPAQVRWLKDSHEWLLELPEENLIVKKIWGDGGNWPLRYLIHRPK